MEKIANALFYLPVLLIFGFCLVILFAKEAKIYIAAAIGIFAAISGFYILLRSPVMFFAQCVFFMFGLGAIMFYGCKNFKEEEKSGFNFNLKTLITPFILSFFVLLCAPFSLSLALNKKEAGNFFELGPIFDVNLILLSVIIITLLSGFYTIAFWRKK